MTNQATFTTQHAAGDPSADMDGDGDVDLDDYALFNAAILSRC